MVTIIPAERTPWDVISKAMGENISQNLPGAVQRGYERELGMGSIDKLQGELQNSGGDISKMLPAIARAYTVNPNLQKSGIAEHYLKMAQLGNAQNIPRHNEQGSFQPEQKQELPGFLQQPGQESSASENKFFPTNLPGGQETGNIPQEFTSGQVVPLSTPTEKIKSTKKLMSDYNKAGIPITFEQARSEIEAAEEEKKIHNSEVLAETERRKNSQREYGEKAVSELDKVFPSATPEMNAIFKKKGEEAAAQNRSEADIDRHLAVEAKNFKNMYSNIEKDLSAPRIQNQLQRSFLQSAKDFDQSAADLRVKLKPLLDIGLYDSARKLLTDLGYYPEERETIVNPMSERQKTVLNRVPKGKKEYIEEPVGMGQIPSFQRPYKYDPNQMENIKSGLKDLKEADPNFSLVLARKAFEDKDYDWRIFKDALNGLEEDGFPLEEDQKNQRSILDTPPLNTLEKVLHGIGLQGR